MNNTMGKLLPYWAKAFFGRRRIRPIRTQFVSSFLEPRDHLIWTGIWTRSVPSVHYLRLHLLEGLIITLSIITAKWPGGRAPPNHQSGGCWHLGNLLFSGCVGPYALFWNPPQGPQPQHEPGLEQSRGPPPQGRHK